MNEEQIKANAQKYMDSFKALFGAEPREEIREQTLTRIEDAIRNCMVEYGNDPSVKCIIDMDVLDIMEASL